MSAEELQDSLEVFIEQRDQLPAHCPNWCNGRHLQALEEGCDLEASSVHRGPDYVVSASKSDQRAHANVQLTADHHPISFWKLPIIDLELTAWLGDEHRRLEVPLTSGEARVLARQLIHLADLADLD